VERFCSSFGIKDVAIEQKSNAARILAYASTISNHELRVAVTDKNIWRSSSKHHLLHQSLPFDPEMHDGTILHAMKYIDAYPNMNEQNLLLDLQVDEPCIAFFRLRLGFDHWLFNPRGFASHQRFNFWDIDYLSNCKKIAIQCSTDAAADAADAAATAL